MIPLLSSPEFPPQSERLADVTHITPRSSGELYYIPDRHEFGNLPAELYESPIRHVITGLGEVTLRNVRTSGGHSSDWAKRHHRMYGVTIHGFQHGVEVTDPVHSGPAYTIMSLPGFTEHIEGGIRQGFHAGLAKIFPDARIISVATDGIGENSSSYSWHELSDHNLDGMARHRIELAQALAARLPLFVHATSMGAAISHRMNRVVLANPALTNQLDLRGQFYTSPALVDPHNIPRDMAARFMPGVLWDFAKELGFKSTPSEIISVLSRSRNYGLNGRETLALGNQIMGLLEGTREKDIIEVTGQIPTVVVAGQKDCLAQWPMWHRAEAANPDMVELHSIKGRGHVMAMKPENTCEKLSRTARAKVCQSLGLRPPLTVV